MSQNEAMASRSWDGTRPSQRLERLIGAPFSAGAVLGATLLSYFIYLAVTGQRIITYPASIATYYAFPAALTALCLAALRIRAMAQFRLLLALIGVLTAAFVMELWLEFSSASAERLQPMKKLSSMENKAAYADELAAQVGHPIDTRSHEDVLGALRHSYGRAIRVTPPEALFKRHPGRISSMIKIDGREVMPLAGPSNIATLLCNENGQWVHVLADQNGFSNPRSAWDSPVLDLAILGDSYAHGYCVPPEASFAGLLRRSFGRTLNLGMAGHGPLLTLATLTHHLPPYRPRVVLWFYYEGNDLENLQAERHSPVLVKYLDEGFEQPLLRRQSEIDEAILELVEARPTEQELPRRRWQDGMRHAAHFAKLSSLRYRLGLISPTTPAEIDLETANYHVFRDVLQTAKSRVESWGGRMIVVYLPDWNRFAPGPRLLRSISRRSQDTARNRVLAIMADAGIEAIDLVPVFEGHPDPLSLFPFREPGHYTEAGHRVVAEAVRQRLTSPAGAPSVTDADSASVSLSRPGGPYDPLPAGER
jgi:hypothetical protein